MRKRECVSVWLFKRFFARLNPLDARLVQFFVTVSTNRYEVAFFIVSEVTSRLNGMT